MAAGVAQGEGTERWDVAPLLIIIEFLLKMRHRLLTPALTMIGSYIGALTEIVYNKLY